MGQSAKWLSELLENIVRTPIFTCHFAQTQIAILETCIGYQSHIRSYSDNVHCYEIDAADSRKISIIFMLLSVY